MTEFSTNSKRYDGTSLPCRLSYCLETRWFFSGWYSCAACITEYINFGSGRGDPLSLLAASGHALGMREAVVNIYLSWFGGSGGAVRNLEPGGEADEYGYSYKMIPKPEGGIDRIYKVLPILLQRHGLGAFEEEWEVQMEETSLSSQPKTNPLSPLPCKREAIKTRQERVYSYHLINIAWFRLGLLLEVSQVSRTWWLRWPTAGWTTSYRPSPKHGLEWQILWHK